VVQPLAVLSCRIGSNPPRPFQAASSPKHDERLDLIALRC
jgi:hypothetical protein